MEQDQMDVAGCGIVWTMSVAAYQHSLLRVDDAAGISRRKLTGPHSQSAVLAFIDSAAAVW